MEGENENKKVHDTSITIPLQTMLIAEEDAIKIKQHKTITIPEGDPVSCLQSNRGEEMPVTNRPQENEDIFQAEQPIPVKVAVIPDQQTKEAPQIESEDLPNFGEGE